MKQLKYKVGDRVIVLHPAYNGGNGVVTYINETHVYPYKVKIDGVDPTKDLIFGEEELLPNYSWQQASTVTASQALGVKPLDNRIVSGNQGVAALPAGSYQVKIWGGGGSGALDKLTFDLADNDSTSNDTLAAKRKDRGECVSCGNLRGMSAYGLLECTYCPPPTIKQ